MRGQGQSVRTAQPPATARCGEVELPPVQFGSHLIGHADPPVAVLVDAFLPVAVLLDGLRNGLRGDGTDAA